MDSEASTAHLQVGHTTGKISLTPAQDYFSADAIAPYLLFFSLTYPVPTDLHAPRMNPNATYAGNSNQSLLLPKLLNDHARGSISTYHR